MSDHDEETPAIEPAKCRWNSDSFGSTKHSRCRNIDIFSFTELQVRASYTSCSTFDVRTK